MIFQDPMSSLNPRRTIASIIAAPLKQNGMGDNLRDRVAEALRRVGLPESFATRYRHELSGGQRQRVGIARALALSPKFVLADEIVSGLDVSTQAQILTLLEKLADEMGLTVAFISHDLSVVRRLCKQVIVMRSGEIVEAGPTDALFDDTAAQLYARADRSDPTARDRCGLARREPAKRHEREASEDVEICDGMRRTSGRPALENEQLPVNGRS